MRAATWLLTHVGVDQALIGDLIEQRRAGRSRAWCWRQVVVVLLSAVARDLAAHPVRATIAALLGLVIRYLAIRAWSAYEPAIDMNIAEALLHVMPLQHAALLIVVSWVNAMLLAPAWFAIGFVVARLSHGAVFLFVAVALALLLPGVARQFEHTITSDMIRWLLPVQLAVFGASIGGFVFSTLLGAGCGLGQGHEIA
jgi:hypothetical protein